MRDLPDELQERCLASVSWRDLSYSCESVCKCWQRLVNQLRRDRLITLDVCATMPQTAVLATLVMRSRLQHVAQRAYARRL
jgi:hypothetical protein